MSTELAHNQPMTPVSNDIVARMREQAEAWAGAAQLAEQIARTDFAGPFKGKPADLAVAILKGATLGIPATDIGKAIYVVHGTPALYGKTALAIALQHGYIAETLEDTPTAVTVAMTSPNGQRMEVRYTIERATREGLVKGNKIQYETRPSKMLYWKCIGELTDRMIPHLLGGMPIKEDWEQSTVKVTAKRKDSQGMDAVREVLARKQESQELPAPAPEPTSVDALTSFVEQVNKAGNYEEVNAIMNSDKVQALEQEAFNELASVANAKVATFQ